MSNTKKSLSKGKCLLYLLCVTIVFHTKWLEGSTSWAKLLLNATPGKSANDIKRSTSNDIRESQKV